MIVSDVTALMNAYYTCYLLIVYGLHKVTNRVNTCCSSCISVFTSFLEQNEQKRQSSSAKDGLELRNSYSSLVFDFFDK